MTWRARIDLCASGYVVVLIAALLLPLNAHVARGAWLTPVPEIASLEELLFDIVGNAALLVPLGVWTYWRLHTLGVTGWRSVTVTLLASLAFSVTTESLQYLLRWRESSLIDVISQVVGAGLGAVVAAEVLGWAPAVSIVDGWPNTPGDRPGHPVGNGHRARPPGSRGRRDAQRRWRDADRRH
jgi:glycopeptide antibiotics resistance protein